MVTKITDGVKITVETTYQPEYSNPANSHYMFSYKIFIENLSEYTVQLLTRHWFIFDSNGTHREVQGEGVIGVQPVIEPGETHEYISGCNLKTEMGKMSGKYVFKRIVDNQSFEVSIPEFELLCPFKLN